MRRLALRRLRAMSEAQKHFAVPGYPGVVQPYWVLKCSDDGS